MSANLGQQTDLMLDNWWSAWTNMFPMIPYWDPYGALAAVFLAVIGMAVAIRYMVR